MLAMPATVAAGGAKVHTKWGTDGGPSLVLCPTSTRCRVDGGHPKLIVRRYVERFADRLVACYDEELPDNPAWARRSISVTVDFVIGEDGTVTSVKGRGPAPTRRRVLARARWSAKTPIATQVVDAMHVVLRDVVPDPTLTSCVTDAIDEVVFPAATSQTKVSYRLVYRVLPERSSAERIRRQQFENPFVFTW